jgi:arylsulfatase A-like enzyme
VSVLKPAAALLAVAVAVLALGRTPPPAARPSVVVVLVDTLRADHLPPYGYAKDTAPFLTRLAAGSVVFTDAQTTAPWTAPATASLFTSLYPFQHRVDTGFMVTTQMREIGQEIRLNRLPADVPTMPEVMQAAGYTTFGITANVNIGVTMGFARGFDRFRHFPEDVPATELGEKAKQWERGIRGAQPYFLYMHFLDPHAPYRENAPWYAATGDAAADRVAAYDSEIRLVDSVLEELFRALGWGRDTVLIVLADHGEEFGDHGGRGHGQTLHSEMLHVPLIVHAPGRFAPRRVAEPVSLLDVLPTLRELAGAPAEARDEGRSLRALLEGGPQDPERRSLLAHLLRRDQQDRLLHSVRRGRWKYIEGSRDPALLFDLARDPGEQANLVEAQATLAGHLRENLRGMVRGSKTFAGGQGTQIMDPATAETLRSLGYVH